jgi:hypothetical protein
MVELPFYLLDACTVHAVQRQRLARLSPRVNSWNCTNYEVFCGLTRIIILTAGKMPNDVRSELEEVSRRVVVFIKE